MKSTGVAKRVRNRSGHAANLSSLSIPRITILSASSGNGALQRLRLVPRRGSRERLHHALHGRVLPVLGLEPVLRSAALVRPVAML
jgi:hypothetical protein